MERANQTLQDRLVKELRLRAISELDTANAFLPTFIAAHNAHFAVSPHSNHDAHRPVLHSPKELTLILCRPHPRKLSKNLTLQFQNREYPLQGYGRGYRLRGATVTVCAAFDGTITLLYQGRTLTYRLLVEGSPPIPLDDAKSLHRTVDQAQAKQATHPVWKPAPDHPWKRTRKPTSPPPSLP